MNGAGTNAQRGSVLSQGIQGSSSPAPSPKVTRVTYPAPESSLCAELIALLLGELMSDMRQVTPPGDSPTEPAFHSLPPDHAVTRNSFLLRRLLWLLTVWQLPVIHLSSTAARGSEEWVGRFPVFPFIPNKTVPRSKQEPKKIHRCHTCARFSPSTPFA